MAPRPQKEFRTASLANRWSPRVRLGLALARLAEGNAWHLGGGVGWGWGDPSCGLGLHVRCGIELSGTESALFIGRALYRHAPPSSPNWAAQRWILSREGITVSEFLQINLSGTAVLMERDTHPPPPLSGFSCSFCERRPFLGFWRPLWMQLKIAVRFLSQPIVYRVFQKDARIQNACIKRTGNVHNTITYCLKRCILYVLL